MADYYSSRYSRLIWRPQCEHSLVLHSDSDLDQSDGDGLTHGCGVSKTTVTPQPSLNSVKHLQSSRKQQTAEGLLLLFTATLTSAGTSAAETPTRWKRTSTLVPRRSLSSSKTALRGILGSHRHFLQNSLSPVFSRSVT